MLFTNLAGKWPAVIVTLLLFLAIVAGLLYVAPETIGNQPTTAGAGRAESTSALLIQKQTGTSLGWEWVVIAALVGVIIGMTVGIALSRPSLTS